MTINANLVSLDQFAVGLLIGSLVRTATQRPLVSIAVIVTAIAVFVYCLNDPSCRQAQCILDGALVDLSDAIAWWIGKPALALGCTVGFAIAALPQSPSPT